jgi:Ca2+-binding RTX toxin-like protein
VNVNLAAGTATALASGIASIEHVFAGAGNGVLIGNQFANILLGGRGQDTLIGGLGRNVLIGGSDFD